MVEELSLPPPFGPLDSRIQFQIADVFKALDSIAKEHPESIPAICASWSQLQARLGEADVSAPQRHGYTDFPMTGKDLETWAKSRRELLGKIQAIFAQRVEDQPAGAWCEQAHGGGEALALDDAEVSQAAHRAPVTAPIHVYFDLAGFSDKQIAEVLSRLSDLYHALSGDVLVIEGTDPSSATSGHE